MKYPIMRNVNVNEGNDSYCPLKSCMYLMIRSIASIFIHAFHCLRIITRATSEEATFILYTQQQRTNPCTLQRNLSLCFSFSFALNNLHALRKVWVAETKILGFCFLFCSTLRSFTKISKLCPFVSTRTLGDRFGQV